MISEASGQTIQNLPVAYPWSHKGTIRPATIANPARMAARQRTASS
jgi:hypothetical protein